MTFAIVGLIDFELDEQAIQIAMGLRRIVSAFAGKLRHDKSDGARPARAVGQRADHAGQAVAGETGRFHLGHGRDHKSASAKSSGHIYFTLKDAGAQLSCVLFRGEAVMNRSLLQDGQKVLLQGDVTVYEARGQYQLIVRAVELQGVGALQIAFEKLKQKLAAEGLFAQERKRPLPRYPQRIGLVTSPTGAAIRDVLHVVQRRHPALEIILAPCRVQGDGAAEEIAEAIRLLNEWHTSPVESSRCADRTARRTVPTNGLDLILVTRGGGSLEDLWAFNEEVVARAIFESAIPVVSAIGHEIDFTIADFVADLRAATPSAAAEIITEGVFASREFVADATDTMRQRLRQRLTRERENFDDLTRRMTRAHPRRRSNELLQRLDDLQAGLLRRTKQGTREQRVAWQNLVTRLLRIRPKQLLKQRREVLKVSRRRLRELDACPFAKLAKSFWCDRSAFAFARTGAGFGTRLFDHDGRRVRAHHPSRKGHETRSKPENTP